MGYDIYGNGEVVVPKGKIAEASKALHEGLLKDIADYMARPLMRHEQQNGRMPMSLGWSGVTEPYPPTEDATEFVGHITDYINGFCIFHDEDDGHITIQAPDDGFRNLDDVESIFAHLAPFFTEDSEGFTWDGDDGYKWMWEFDKGGMEEINSEVVYGNDVNAPAVVQKIIEMIYPNGKPVTVTADYAGGHIIRPEHSNCLSLIEEIEGLLRSNNFGPQAGMNELERMADV